MEQKNNVVVRSWVGHPRFDTQRERGWLNHLWKLHRSWYNFLVPQMKLMSKQRNGSKVRRRCGTPSPPYRRVLRSKALDDAGQANLKQLYEALNPARLRREMLDITDQLWRYAASKERQYQYDR